jgi:hypothetical protein
MTTELVRKAEIIPPDSMPELISLKSNDRETDLMRLADLTKQHGLSYRCVGNTYRFDDRIGPDAFEDGCIYTARGLREALAFAEGYDRAKSGT